MPQTVSARATLDETWSSILMQAELTPHSTALADAGGNVSYRELIDLVVTLSDQLETLGVVSNDLVAVRLPRGRDAVVAVLATLRLGAGYVPLDPVYPEARLRMMIEETRPKALISEDGVIPLVGAEPQADPAYVIFTSGSTGKPKGVLIGRDSLRDFSRTFAERFGFTAGDRILQFASLSFDVSVEEIFPALITGAAVVLRDDEMISHPALFFDRCKELGITILDLPTAYWHELVASLHRGEAELPSTVRCVIIGGETARPDALRQWQSAVGHGGARLFNTYGPTEATVGATAADVTDWSGTIVPIGVPHEGVTCRIGDDDELFIGGIGVAQGYLNRPELNADRFVIGSDGAREYRTGDRARWSDGQLEFLGRLDDQVKIRGHRVEPGEVEAVLRSLDQIDDAMVLVDESSGRSRLVGHVVTADSTDLEAVKRELADVLPAYLVPSTLQRHARLPLTPQGKIDRVALSTMQHGPLPTAPLVGADRAAAILIEEVLGVSITSTTDDFLSLGGDSLDAIRLLAAVRLRHGADLTLTKWYASPTVASLAAAIATAVTDHVRDGPVVDPDATGLTEGLTEGLTVGLAEMVRHPLNPMQRDYWIAEQVCAPLPVYTLGIRYQWSERPDAAVLRRVLNALSRRHPMLRSRFPEDRAEPSMIIDPVADLPLTLGEPDRSAVNIRTGPVAHAFLQHDELTLVVHHLAFDGWSAGIFGQELALLYRAAVDGADSVSELLSELQPIRATPDLAGLAAMARARPTLVSYWQERFSEADLDLELPADRPAPITRSFASARVTRRLNPELLDRLRVLASGQRASLFMVVFAALQVVLRRYTGRTDITVLSPTAGRSSGELGSFIGPALNALPLRCEVAGDPTFADLVTRVRDAVLNDLDHQDLSLPDIVASLARSGATKLVTPVMLTVHNTPAPADPILKYSGELAPVATMVDLAIGLDFPHDGALLTADYAVEMFDEERIDALLDHLVTVLDAATECNSEAISMMPLLTGAEYRRLVHEGNTTDTPILGEVAVHQFFEHHAAVSPDSAALTTGGVTLSYGELNGRANRLARHLRLQGVQPGQRVAISLDRGVDLFAVMWAVLKAGGAYVPIDPAYPAERRAAMLADSAPAVVVDRLYLSAITLPDDDSDLPLTVGTDDPAYVIYTSGSTGTPKGVVVTHGNLVHAVGMWRHAYGLRSDWTYLQAASFSFDMFVGETLRAQTNGGRLVVADRETLLDPAALCALMETEQVRCTELVPAVLRALLDHVDATGGHLRFVRLLIGGGEKWFVREYRQAQRLVGDGNRVVNSYGVTEATVDNVFFEGNTDDLADNAALPIGRPFPGNRVYVLDTGGQPTPAGVIGELHLGGHGVASGYHANLALTEARFVPDPFADVPGARMYRTGDMARMSRSGAVDFLGRLDDQVKVNGYRIELGDIEAALRALPGVTASAASIKSRPDGLPHIVGYVVWADGAEADDVTVRDNLANALPEHMLPARFVTLSTLPSTPNGKLDRNRLPDPSDETGTRNGVGPRTDTERRIAEIWSELLGITDPAIDDSFFLVGGDSFAALKVVRRVDPTLSLVEFYQNPTIRRLAAHLDGRSEDEPTQQRLLHRLSAGGDESRTIQQTIVAIPYSGGSAVAFRPLAEALPDGWALHAVELPGHDRARPDDELEPIDVVADRIVAELVALDGPVLLYGHCLGVALTVEVARRAEKAGVQVTGVALGAGFPTARLPGRVFDWLYRHLPIDRFTSDREYLDYLRARGGFTDIDDDEQKAFTLRNVRHDARDAEEYFTAAYGDEFERLNAPVLSVVGARDRVTEHYQERYHEWDHFTAERVDLAVLPFAGHFFVKDHAEPLAGVLEEFVAGVATGDRAVGKIVHDPAPEVPQAAQVQPNLRKFGVVAFGQLLSMIGSSLSSFVLSVWVFQQTGSLTDFALINAIGLLPGILIGPFAGAVADRWDKRKIMLTSDSVAAMAMVTLVLLILTGGLQMWQVYLTVCITSVSGAFQRPAYLAAVAQLVPKRFLGHASGIGQLGAGVGMVFAPLIGVSLLGLIGIGGVLIVDMVTFAIGALTLLFTRIPNLRFRRRPEGFGVEIRNGWLYILRRPGLRSALRYFVIDHVFYVLGFAVITPLLLLEQSAGVAGLALGAAGVGALTGSVTMGVWGGTVRRTHGMLISMTVGSAAMILIGLTTEPALIVLGMFLMGIAESLADGHWTAIVQTKVGLELQGRVLSLFITLMMLTVPIGYLVVGPLAERFVQPLLEQDGALADTLGAFIGTGPGRALALLIILSGVLQLAWAIFGWSDARLRLVEDELPDAVLPTMIGTRDDLQSAADALLASPASRRTAPRRRTPHDSQ